MPAGRLLVGLTGHFGPGPTMSARWSLVVEAGHFGPGPTMSATRSCVLVAVSTGLCVAIAVCGGGCLSRVLLVGFGVRVWFAWALAQLHLVIGRS